MRRAGIKGLSGRLRYRGVRRRGNRDVDHGQDFRATRGAEHHRSHSCRMTGHLWLLIAVARYCEYGYVHVNDGASANKRRAREHSAEEHIDRAQEVLSRRIEGAFARSSSLSERDRRGRGAADPAEARPTATLPHRSQRVVVAEWLSGRGLDGG